jgi:hypothetical protein
MHIIDDLYNENVTQDKEQFIKSLLTSCRKKDGPALIVLSDTSHLNEIYSDKTPQNGGLNV